MPAKRLILALIAIAVLCFRTASLHADYTNAINPSVTWGTWEGWGASLCWWANVFGDRDDLANLIFTTNYTTLNGQTLPGLGMNVARYNAGACSTNSVNGGTMQASTNIPPFKQIQGFWLDGISTNPSSASWNWNADLKQRTMLLKAKARGANLFELFSNSPMWWMLYNSNPSGADNGANDNLPSGNYAAHAACLATVALYASTNWGLAFDSVEPFNEPSGTWWTSTNTQEGCHFSTGAQTGVVAWLRAELDARDLTNMNVAASDETSYDAARSTWAAFSVTTKAQVGRVNVHGYQYGSGRRDLLYSAVSGKRLWNSEYGEGDGTGISLARNLNLDFQSLHMTAWCYWQPFDSGGWGLVQSNPGDNWIGTANPKYYVAAHYSRHIRPGMLFLSSGDGNTVAAHSRGGRKLVLVTANYTNAQSVTYSLTNLPYAAGPVRRWATLMGGTGDKYVLNNDVVVSNQTFTCSFPTNTIQTLEIDNVDLAVPLAPTGLAAVPGVEKVSLHWTSALGATNYNIKRATNSAGPFLSIGVSGSTNFTSTGVPGGATCFYVVSGLNGAGESADSATVSVVPYGRPMLQITRDNGSNLHLAWPDWASGLVLRATNMATNASWAFLTNRPWATNGTMNVILPSTNGPRQFYRLQSF